MGSDIATPTIAALGLLVSMFVAYWQIRLNQRVQRLSVNLDQRIQRLHRMRELVNQIHETEIIALGYEIAEEQAQQVIATQKGIDFHLDKIQRMAKLSTYGAELRGIAEITDDPQLLSILAGYKEVDIKDSLLSETMGRDIARHLHARIAQLIEEATAEHNRHWWDKLPHRKR